jgi:manganese efflux pump family protein
MPAETA